MKLYEKLVKILDYIKGSTNSLKDTINSKYSEAVITDTTPLSEYPDKIANIDINYEYPNDAKITNVSNLFTNNARNSCLNYFLKLVDWSKISSFQYLFSGSDELEYINTKLIDTQSCVNMNYMFQNCKKLKIIDLSNFDTSNVTSMSSMFSNCQSLQTIDLSNFDTSNVTSMSSMFQNSGIKKIKFGKNLNNLNIRMNYMFQNCKNIESIDFKDFDTSKVTSLSYFTYGCDKLNELLNLNISSVSSISTNDIYNVKRLTFTGTTTVKGNINIIYCKLTRDSLFEMLDSLPNIRENNYTRNITIKSDLKKELTEEDIEVFSNKGYIIK